MIKHGEGPFLECSTKGDKRFSAFCAKIKALGGLSIEEIYQAEKVFDDGSTGMSWREAKGRKAINMEGCTILYNSLWIYYILEENKHLIEVLHDSSGVSDIFGQAGHCCQATVLWNIRNATPDSYNALLRIATINLNLLIDHTKHENFTISFTPY